MKIIDKKNSILIIISFLTLIFFSCGSEDVNAPGGATLILAANPLSIPADGVSTAVIEAIVQDSTGHALNGTSVYFTTTLGSITQKATVENGIARAILTAGEEEGTASVRAVTGTLSDSVDIYIGFQNVTIFLTANPSEIPADEQSTSTIQAYITEEKGIVPDGTDVFFTTTLGSITSNTITENGLAEAILTSSLTEGTATVTAIVSNISQTTDVTIGIPVSTIFIDVNPSTFEVSTADAQTHVANVTVTVWNAAGIPIENKPVVITSDLGQLDSGGTVQKTNANGQVTDTFRITIAVPQGTSQTVRITATSGSISATGNITIINQG
jgi:adhesin/invasin